MYSKTATISRTIIVCVLLLAFISSCQQKEDKVYLIARDSQWQSLNLSGKERSLLAFSNELLVEIAREENFRIELIHIGSENLFQGLARHEYDAVLSPVSPSPRKQQIYIFSDPFFLIGPVVVANKGSSIDSIKDLKDTVVGIERGTSPVYRSYQDPSANVKIYDNMTYALEDLTNYHIDAVIMSAVPAYLQSQGLFSGKIKIITEPLNDQGLRLIAQKNAESEKLVEAFNSGLAKVKENGEYDKMLEKWALPHLKRKQ